MKIIILIHCADRGGIISSVTTFIKESKGNVVYLDQHVDKSIDAFFMRLESEFDPKTFVPQDFKRQFSAKVAQQYAIQWSMHTEDVWPRMALFVSKYNHCLYDLLSRFYARELKAHIPFILSNHPDLKPIADQFNIPFYHVPVGKWNKKEAEREHLALLKKHQVDFVVLARYMQIVGKDLIDAYPNKIINIHHSFLPAFAGAKPYHAAFERGVKIIGATSHYVTEDLDEGPIIEQDVTYVTHAHSIKHFIAKGRDLEKIVLSRAVKLHLDRKTMVHNNKTIIFS
ncbi:formyltetrahydrofolate deformylase [Maribacter sp. 2307ULW6-5]|uniref:formyltetrahydrofolate deformylase n=1 Tax=Maribacter sp. 2307ULW6-5 TaxID=3386275 RepID=UPI0039BC9C0D